MTNDRVTPPAKPVLQAGTWQQSWWIPLPHRLKRAVIWARFRSPYARWRTAFVYTLLRLFRYRPSEDDISRWATAEVESLGAVCAQEGVPESTLAELFESELNYARKVGDHYKVEVYSRAAELARQRYSAPSRAPRSTLTRPREQRAVPRRRSSTSTSLAGKDPPEEDPESDLASPGPAGPVRVEAAR